MDALQGRSPGTFWLEVLRPLGKTLALVKSEPLPPPLCLAPLPQLPEISHWELIHAPTGLPSPGPKADFCSCLPLPGSPELPGIS